MADDECLYDLDMLDLQLQCLLGQYPSEELRRDSKPFCADYFQLVKEYTSRWHVPLPQLRIIEKALLYFTQATSSLTSSCDHLLSTLSSLALSIFELLLFFDGSTFEQEPLKHFTVTFQECYAALSRHQNVHLQQVAHLIQNGGPWASEAMQAILSESSLSQSDVGKYLSSELPVFFELRVRYLLSCERVTEALALAKCCAQDRATGRHLFFLHTYLTWLLKTSQHHRLQTEVADFSGQDAVQTICSLESEATDETLLALCRAFLSQQLKTRDMQCLCDLVFIWSKLHSRLKTQKEALIEESLQLMSSSTDVHSIFPFIRALTQELGEQAVQVCVEVCAKALQSCPPCDVFTKSLLYKTIAGLLQNDLEVCRACALLVFFLERSVEAYKLVHVLYMHPDQEYHVDHNPIQNHIRFETLQVLKKDMYFDPEFWNLFALRTNCLELMSEKVVGDALKEITEEKWISSYCRKLFPFGPRILSNHSDRYNAAVKKRPQKVSVENAAKRMKVDQSLDGTVRRRRMRSRNQSSKRVEESSTEPLRRSFWQLDRRHGIGPRRTTRFSEKITAKRRIRQPKWLLEDSGTLEENIVPAKLRRMRRQGIGWRKTESDQIKDSSRRKLKADSDTDAQPEEEEEEPPVEPQSFLELSLPDNELPGTFPEDVSHNPRAHTPKPVCRQTSNLPVENPPPKPALGKEVILRARDFTTLVQLLHCYGRRQSGSGTNVPGSVSTITRSSVQANPAPTPAREHRGAVPKSQALNGLHSEMRKRSSLPSRVYSARRKRCDPGEEPAVEINVSIASQTGAMDKLPQRSADPENHLNNFSQAEAPAHKRPSSPRKEVPSNAGELQCCPPSVKTVCSVKEQVEEKPEETRASPHSSASSLQIHKTNAESKSHPLESMSSKRHAEEHPGATTSFTASENLQRPLVKEEEEASDDDMESTVVSEESRLEFSCSSCQKVFKGSRVVEHAMFHFRRDECMFCWTVFKDDLLAMMHMSDHIEKLKRAANRNQDGGAEETRSPAAAKTSPKTRVPSNARPCGMLRRSGVPHRSTRTAEQDQSEGALRKLNGHLRNRSSLGVKRMMSKSKMKWLLQQKERTPDGAENGTDESSAEKCPRGRIPSVSGPPEEKPSLRMDSEDLPVRMLRVHNARKDSQQKVKEENHRPAEMVHCPAEGCAWNTDLSKNRVALLYHALEEHREDTRPLALSFDIANGKCSICMRVLWSFEHFQHHVERHRVSPRHPCLHQGCSARFKTGMEMRRHARMHDPLQARCCRPGCTKLFICLWALNLHEKDHYAGKPWKESLDASHTSTKKNLRPEVKDPRDSLGRSSADPGSDVEEPASSDAQRMDSDPERPEPDPSITENTDSSKETASSPEKNLDPSKTLKALSSFLSKHKPKVHPGTKDAAQINRRKQRRPCKREEEEESWSTDSETAENRSGLVKSEDEETTVVKSGVPRRRGRPSKVKEREDVKEEADEMSITEARPEERGAGGERKRGRGRPPKRKPGAKPVEDEAGPTPAGTTEPQKMPTQQVPYRKRGRPLKLRRETPHQSWGDVPKTGRALDGTRPTPTRLKNKWQQVPRTGQRRIKFNVKKVGHDGFISTGLKRRTVQLRRSVEGGTKVMTQEERTTIAGQKVTEEKGSSTEEATVGTGVCVETTEAACETVKRSIEVAEGASAGPSQVEKPHVELKTSRSVSQQNHPDPVLPDDGPSVEVEGEKAGHAQEPAQEPARGSRKGGAKVQKSSQRKPQFRHGHRPAGEEKSGVCVSTLIEYAKKPYLRLPPTAYLDEKFTTMPRRKKEMLDQHMSQVNVAPQEPPGAAASAPLQRHRCANCFAFFASAGELQEHQQRRSCSNLFGFDSDEEGHA